MPGCTLHLIHLKPSTSIPSFLKSINSEILWAGKVQQALIKPTKIDPEIINSTWDLGLLLKGDSGLNPEALKNVAKEYRVSAGVPSRVLDNYLAKNAEVRALPPPDLPITHGNLPKPSSVPIQSSVATSLEANAPLLEFAHKFTASYPRINSNVSVAVSMINLLHFSKAPDAKQNYFKYGQAFNPVAGKRGGWAKIVGNVVESSHPDSRKSCTPQDWWNEISVVHYPSIAAFVDMSMDPVYQDANKTYRLKALDDTALICTVDIDLSSAKL